MCVVNEAGEQAPIGSDTAEFRSLFGGDVVFGAAVNELAFPRSTKEMAVVSADPYLNEVLIKYCKQALADRSTKRCSFECNIENAIAVLLPQGQARAGGIARKLGVSRRTLARRLSSEGLTFAGVLQRLKFDLAKRHLADETLSVSEIAWLLGYQDVSAFTLRLLRSRQARPCVSRHLLRAVAVWPAFLLLTATTVGALLPVIGPEGHCAARTLLLAHLPRKPSTSMRCALLVLRRESYRVHSRQDGASPSSRT
jgi:AraC-like DNA-binding protein